MACDRCNCCFSFWVIFALLPHPTPLPSNSPKNENFKKMKRKPGHKCTKTHDHMPTSITNISNIAIIIIITIIIITFITIMIFMIIIIIITFSLATYT